MAWGGRQRAMKTAQHRDKLAKNQPAEIAMFQIPEVQESPAFNGRRSFLTTRGQTIANYTDGTYNLPANTLFGATGNTFVVSGAAIPEPSTITMFGIGAGVMGLVSIRRRRREQNQAATA